MTPQEMERRLLNLERRVSGSQGGFTLAYGQSTLFGAASQNYRDHFPVKLTSSYSSSTGYSWQRRGLDRAAASPTVVDLSTPQSGKYAFTPDNDTSLTSGTYGYLVAEPCAGGWLFLKSAAGGSGSISISSAALASPQNITTGGVLNDVTGVSITTSATGRYRVWWTLSAAVQVTAGISFVTGAGPGMWVFLVRQSGSDGPYSVVSVDSESASKYTHGSTGGGIVEDSSSGTVYKLQVESVDPSYPPGVTWGLAQVQAAKLYVERVS